MVSEKPIPIIVQLLALILCVLVCSTIGTLLSLGISEWTGVDISQLSADDMLHHRWTLRLLLGIGQWVTFLLPGILFCVWLYKKDWAKTVQLGAWPPLQPILMAGMTMLLSAGWVAYTAQLNQLIPLPDWAISAEEETAQLIKAVLEMNHIGELLASLVVVALLPAMGEEWIFRGILQSRLLQALNNPHLAVGVAAIIFSAIHFQFQGFLPRMFLGVILGYIFLYSRNLWLPIIAHFINNAYQVFGYYIQSQTAMAEDLDPSDMPQVSPWVGLFSLLAVVILMWLLQRYYRPQKAIGIP